MLSGQVTSAAIEAVGIRKSIYGNPYVDAAGNVLGTVNSVFANNVADGSTIVSFSDLNVPAYYYANGVLDLPSDAELLSGIDAIYGGSGNDYLRGDAGNDGLYGGNGYDTLGGGTGIDYMQGGSGNDTCLVDDSLDQIVDLSGYLP